MANPIEVERVVPMTRPFSAPDGEVVDKITVRRPTVGEVNAYLDDLEKGVSPNLPMLVSPSGRHLAEADLGDMLDDDLFDLNEVINTFFPKRLRAILARVSETSATSSGSSQPNSDGPAPTSSPSNGQTPSDGQPTPMATPAPERAA